MPHLDLRDHRVRRDLGGRRGRAWPVGQGGSYHDKSVGRARVHQRDACSARQDGASERRVGRDRCAAEALGFAAAAERRDQGAGAPRDGSRAGRLAYGDQWWYPAAAVVVADARVPAAAAAANLYSWDGMQANRVDSNAGSALLDVALWERVRALPE